MASDTIYKIAHLSDLHLTSDDNGTRSEPRIFGPLKGMNTAFRQVVSSTAIQGADLILITGDVTDRGEVEAWRLFWNRIKDAGLADKVRVVPGNHDLCCLSLRLGHHALGQTRS